MPTPTFTLTGGEVTTLTALRSTIGSRFDTIVSAAGSLRTREAREITDEDIHVALEARREADGEMVGEALVLPDRNDAWAATVVPGKTLAQLRELKRAELAQARASEITALNTQQTVAASELLAAAESAFQLVETANSRGAVAANDYTASTIRDTVGGILLPVHAGIVSQAVGNLITAVQPLSRYWQHTKRRADKASVLHNFHRDAHVLELAPLFLSAIDAVLANEALASDDAAPPALS